MSDWQVAKLLVVSDSEVVKEYGIAVRFLGNLSYLPPDVADLARRAEEQTKNNTK